MLGLVLWMVFVGCVVWACVGSAVCMCVGSVVCTGVGVWVAWWMLLKPTPPPTQAILPYTRKSLFYPLKVIIFYCFVKLRKKSGRFSKGAGYGSRSYSRVEMMERPQPLHPNPKVPGRGLLVSPKHPDTITFRDEKDEDKFATGNITIMPESPMKVWRLKFSGKLRPHDQPEGDSVDVKVDLLWTSNLPHFDFDTDMDILTTAKAFANEAWSKEYFTFLRKHHQTHYEQMGQLEGSVSIDGASSSLLLPSFRDHSYGKMREWRLMHRYVFHHIFLQDGSKGVVGVVCQPSTCSRLILGHWWTVLGEGAAVTSMDLQLHQHGERGTPPTDYAFCFTAGGVEYLVEAQVEVSAQHYLGWDWEARMLETWVTYRVNGVEGSGICEWNYCHGGGRPDALNSADPEWAIKYRPRYLAA
ncbi:uncharacterized protein [Procambarus clarkii]|uniref:uncharacterized protein isoform X2 n=1 Tax=Procambarus clarkii TaxID=6728 RepID=UPI001E671B2C|nr:uncharacterized protein LOC123768740 isoform X2 [Procambarus clarkii]